MTAPTQPDPHARRRQSLDGGRLLAGLGALALLVSLFLDWWGPSAAVGDFEGSDGGITAWNVFELIDILLAALALAVLGFAIEGFVRPGSSRLPAALAAAAGPIALVLIVVSLVNEPLLLKFSDAGLEAGAWLALGGAVVMTIGSLLRYARISINVTPRERTTREPAPETETRPLSEEPRRPPR